MQSHDVELKELIEEEELEFEYYEGRLGPVVGWPEWKALIAVFKHALTWLPMVVGISAYTVVHVYTNMHQQTLKVD